MKYFLWIILIVMMATRCCHYDIYANVTVGDDERCDGTIMNPCASFHGTLKFVTDDCFIVIHITGGIYVETTRVFISETSANLVVVGHNAMLLLDGGVVTMANSILFRDLLMMRIQLGCAMRTDGGMVSFHNVSLEYNVPCILDSPHITFNEVMFHGNHHSIIFTNSSTNIYINHCIIDDTTHMLAMYYGDMSITEPILHRWISINILQSIVDGKIEISDGGNDNVAMSLMMNRGNGKIRVAAYNYAKADITVYSENDHHLLGGCCPNANVKFIRNLVSMAPMFTRIDYPSMEQLVWRIEVRAAKTMLLMPTCDIWWVPSLVYPQCMKEDAPLPPPKWTSDDHNRFLHYLFGSMVVVSSLIGLCCVLTTNENDPIF
jgi:hypothetical protein